MALVQWVLRASHMTNSLNFRRFDTSDGSSTLHRELTKLGALEVFYTCVKRVTPNIRSDSLLDTRGLATLLLSGKRIPRRRIKECRKNGGFNWVDRDPHVLRLLHDYFDALEKVVSLGLDWI